MKSHSKPEYDEALSRRHREWGFNCPAVDLDFLMVEYNLGKPVALVEYKEHRAQRVDLRHPTYRALIELADMAGLPFILAFYWPDTWAFYVMPVNEHAVRVYKRSVGLSERRFVSSLYYIRGLVIEQAVLSKLGEVGPPADYARQPTEDLPW